MIEKCSVCGKKGGVLVEAVYQKDGEDLTRVLHCPTCNPIQNGLKGNFHIVSMQFRAGGKRND